MISRSLKRDRGREKEREKREKEVVGNKWQNYLKSKCHGSTREIRGSQYFSDTTIRTAPFCLTRIVRTKDLVHLCSTRSWKSFARLFRSVIQTQLYMSNFAKIKATAWYVLHRKRSIQNQRNLCQDKTYVAKSLWRRSNYTWKFS